MELDDTFTRPANNQGAVNHKNSNRLITAHLFLHFV